VGEWLLSRRDGAIVAWHEVHGTAPPKEPSRRVRSDSRRRAHRFNDWSDETSSTITEKYWLGFIKLFLATRYGALSVGISQVQKTLRYIEHQLEHHGTRTLRQEYLAFLKRHEHSTRCRLLMPGAQFRRQISLGLTMTSTVRPGRGSLHRYPGTSCLATIVLSLRDKSHPSVAVIDCPRKHRSTVRPEHSFVCYFTPSRRHFRCTAIASGMALGDRSTVRKANVA
jgi:hypothetical protein